MLGIGWWWWWWCLTESQSFSKRVRREGNEATDEEQPYHQACKEDYDIRRPATRANE